jgi:integrase/recombinase XerD
MLTVNDNVRLARMFLRQVGKPLPEISVSDIRAYFAGLKAAKKPKTYNNRLGALKRFFRDFLRRPDLVESFRFAKVNNGFVSVPMRDELCRFFNALETDRDRALFLFYATTGLRRSEALRIHKGDIDLSTRMVNARHTHESSSTKNAGITFYNEETAGYIGRYLEQRTDTDARLFRINAKTLRKRFRRAELKTGVKITPQKLRDWFCQNMGELGVPDRFVDAFCGRVPASVLARRYTDYRPERLKAVYDRAALRVLQ